MTEHARCPKCRYALVRGVCPICEGRQVSDRLPMVAPLPARPEQEKSTTRTLRFKRRRSA